MNKKTINIKITSRLKKESNKRAHGEDSNKTTSKSNSKKIRVKKK
jgi:hypothetical protein